MSSKISLEDFTLELKKKSVIGVCVFLDSQEYEIFKDNILESFYNGLSARGFKYSRKDFAVNLAAGYYTLISVNTARKRVEINHHRNKLINPNSGWALIQPHEILEWFFEVIKH